MGKNFYWNGYVISKEPATEKELKDAYRRRQKEIKKLLNELYEETDNVEAVNELSRKLHALIKMNYELKLQLIVINNRNAGGI